MITTVNQLYFLKEIQMKSAREVASKVDSSQFNKKTAPGVAQQVILNALGIDAESFGHANAIFDALGITVIAKRVGRSSVPEVIKRDLSGGGFNLDGEGEAWDLTPDIDLSTIKEWMVDNG
jgi:hypothetical protein